MRVVRTPDPPPGMCKTCMAASSVPASSNRRNGSDGFAPMRTAAAQGWWLKSTFVSFTTMSAAHHKTALTTDGVGTSRPLSQREAASSVFL